MLPLQTSPRWKKTKQKHRLKKIKTLRKSQLITADKCWFVISFRPGLFDEDVTNKEEDFTTSRESV